MSTVKPSAIEASEAIERMLRNGTHGRSALQTPGGAYYGIRIEVDGDYVTNSGLATAEALNRLRNDERLEGFDIFVVCHDSEVKC